METTKHASGYDWAAIGRSTEGVGGGDCARVVWRSDGRALFFVGDVAGHDARSAALAAEMDGLVLDLATVVSPARLLKALNAVVEARWPSDVFVSAICFVLDPRTGRGTVAAAGQFPPVVRSACSSYSLSVDAGPALGLVAESQYVEREFTLVAGDVLVAVTDGVTDPLATGSDLLGLAALARLVDRGYGAPADLCSYLMNTTRRSGGHDDATVLAVTPPHPPCVEG